MLDKTELHDGMFNLLEQFHNEFHDAVTNDEPIQGSDAVDILVQLWSRIDQLFGEMNA
jgi:hypothetical protein